MKLKRKGMAYLLVGVLIGLVSIWGCPKKTDVASSPEAGQAEKVTAPGSGQAATAGGQTAAATEGANEKSGASSRELKSIYFDFNQPFIRSDAKSVLEANAAWLKANPKVNVRIEGNCDERGTVEYNQALGQRRDASAKKYLTALGISAKRITLISYGKEKPICSEHDEACWQKNRRDDFVVVSN